MGIVHPIIHAGYGCEFGLPGMVAEGLAMACVQADDMADMFPPSVFQWSGGGDESPQSVNGLTAKLSSVGLYRSADRSGPHALELLAKLANDASFAPTAVGVQDSKEGELPLESILEAAGPRFFEIVSEWAVNGADESEVYSKIEELIWMNVIIYGVAGWSGRQTSANKRFNADFFL